MIRIFKGSILDAPVDLIVNPANSFLRHGGGLARVIDVAATSSVEVNRNEWFTYRTAMLTAVAAYNEWHTQHGLIAVGDATLCPPGALGHRFRGIIQAVGPVWGGGQFFERDLLQSAYRRSMIIAHEKRMSIALPAISAGIFGAPIDVVADEALSAAWVVSRPEFDIYFALMDDAHIEAFQNTSYSKLEVCLPHDRDQRMDRPPRG